MREVHDSPVQGVEGGRHAGHSFLSMENSPEVEPECLRSESADEQSVEASTLTAPAAGGRERREERMGWVVGATHRARIGSGCGGPAALGVGRSAKYLKTLSSSLKLGRDAIGHVHASSDNGTAMKTPASYLDRPPYVHGFGLPRELRCGFSVVSC